MCIFAVIKITDACVHIDAHMYKHTKHCKQHQNKMRTKEQNLYKYMNTSVLIFVCLPICTNMHSTNTCTVHEIYKNWDTENKYSYCSKNETYWSYNAVMQPKDASGMTNSWCRVRPECSFRNSLIMVCTVSPGFPNT